MARRAVRRGMRETDTESKIMWVSSPMKAIGEWVADAPPAVLAALGVRFDPLEGRFRPPGEATIRRVLESVDAGQLDVAVTSWLASAPPAGSRDRGRRRAVAVDGKALRGTRHSSSEASVVSTRGWQCRVAAVSRPPQQCRAARTRTAASVPPRMPTL
jgi:hypothetical protein